MNEGRRPRLLPFVFTLTLAAIIILYVAPWKPQTPWAMVCTTALGLAAMLLGYWEDLPDDDNDT